MRYTKEYTINYAYIQYLGSGSETMGGLQCKSVRFNGKMCKFEIHKNRTVKKHGIQDL